MNAPHQIRRLTVEVELNVFPRQTGKEVVDRLAKILGYWDETLDATVKCKDLNEWGVPYEEVGEALLEEPVDGAELLEDTSAEEAARVDEQLAEFLGNEPEGASLLK